MKQIILMSFSSVSEALNFMNTFQYPCVFTINRNWDMWYDKNGNILENILEQKYPNIMLSNPDSSIICIVDSNQWVNNEYCYDGDFIFITRN